MRYRDSLAAAELRIAALEDELARSRDGGATRTAAPLEARVRELEAALQTAESALAVERASRAAEQQLNAAERERERATHRHSLDSETAIIRQRGEVDVALARVERDKLAADVRALEALAMRLRGRVTALEQEVDYILDDREAAESHYHARIAELTADAKAREVRVATASRERAATLEKLAALPTASTEDRIARARLEAETAFLERRLAALEEELRRDDRELERLRRALARCR